MGHIPNFKSVGDATSFTNTLAHGDAGAFTALQAAQSLLAHNNRLNIMAESQLAAACNQMMKPDPVEAISTQKILTGRDSQGIAESMALAAMLIKLAK